MHDLPGVLDQTKCEAEANRTEEV